jgi:hypothetical protein
MAVKDIREFNLRPGRNLHTRDITLTKALWVLLRALATKQSRMIGVTELAVVQVLIDLCSPNELHSKPYSTLLQMLKRAEISVCNLCLYSS